MSETLKFCTTINDATKLAKACDRMRAADLNTVGPTLKGREYIVRLPKWSKDARFPCDGENRLTGEMFADNYSPYYDERQIDGEGNRIEGTGRVHADVLSGRKRVGQDGHWGDIKYLDRLQQEYFVVGIEEEAQNMGGTIAYSSIDEQTGLLTMEVEVPEAIGV